MVVRDLALTVLELEPNEYHWVLMEAIQAEADDCLTYRPIDSSTRGAPDYSEALVQGAAALRAIQGLGPFGKPKKSKVDVTDVQARPARRTTRRAASEFMLTTSFSSL